LTALLKFGSKLLFEEVEIPEPEPKERTLKADSHIACRAHAFPLPCRAAKDLECVLPV
jgi:hypothetical protein